MSNKYAGAYRSIVSVYVEIIKIKCFKWSERDSGLFYLLNFFFPFLMGFTENDTVTDKITFEAQLMKDKLNLISA